MAAAIIDDSIVLKLLVGQLNTVDPVVRVLGEPERDLGNVAAELIRLSVSPHDRVMADEAEDMADVEFEIVGVVGATAQEAAINLVTRMAMEIATAFNEQRLYDASTGHEVQIHRVSREVEAAGSDTDAQDGPFGLFRLVGTGMARRTSGASLVAP
jgi:hypothetical protein